MNACRKILMKAGSKSVTCLALAKDNYPRTTDIP